MARRNGRNFADPYLDEGKPVILQLSPPNELAQGCKHNGRNDESQDGRLNFPVL
jgi:hypothetical protein